MREHVPSISNIVDEGLGWGLGAAHEHGVHSPGRAVQGRTWEGWLLCATLLHHLHHLRLLLLLLLKLLLHLLHLHLLLHLLLLCLHLLLLGLLLHLLLLELGDHGKLLHLHLLLCRLWLQSCCHPLLLLQHLEEPRVGARQGLALQETH